MNRVILILLLILPVLSWADGFYIGINGPLFPRGALVLGYQLNDINSIEVALLAEPDLDGTLISLVSKNYIDEDDRYVTAGYAIGGYLKETRRGPIFTFGQEFFIDEHNGWSLPVEFGGGLGYNDYEDDWGLMYILNFGVLYGVDR